MKENMPESVIENNVDSEIPQSENIISHQENSATKKRNPKFLIIGLFVALLFVLLGSVLFIYQKNIGKDNLDQNKMKKVAEEVLNEEPIIAIPEYKTETTSLFGLTLTIPANWNLSEINKRPLLSTPGGPTFDYDECADYLITDIQKNIEVTLSPVCGFADGGPDIWPNNAIVVSEISDGIHLIRHEIPDGIIQYGKGYDNDGSGVGKTSSFMLSVGENGLSDSSGDIQLFTVQVKNNVQDQADLLEVDKVIQSIKKKKDNSIIGAKETNLKSFNDPNFPLTFKYSTDLEVIAQEYNDLGIKTVTIQKLGPTQRDATEFYDGVSISFTVENLNGQTLDEYVDKKIEKSKEIGDILKNKEETYLNNIPGLSYTAQGLGIFEQLYFQNGDEVIRIINNTNDPTEQGFDNIAEFILGTFQLKSIR